MKSPRARLLLVALCTLGSIACDDERSVPPPNPTTPTLCGNGRVDKGETCDSRIPTSSVGACVAAVGSPGTELEFAL